MILLTERVTQKFRDNANVAEKGADMMDIFHSLTTPSCSTVPPTCECLGT
jgi:hypothetical protein